MAYFRHFGSLLVYPPSIVMALNQRRGATISAAMPSPSNFFFSSFGFLADFCIGLAIDIGNGVIVDETSWRRNRGTLTGKLQSKVWGGRVVGP